MPRKRENLRFVVVEGVISPTRKQHTKHQQRALFVKRVDKADLDILWEKKMQVRDWLQNFFMSTHTLSEVRHFMAWQNLSWWKLHRVTATKWIQPKENKEERKLFREEKQVTTRKTVSSRAEKNENQQVLQLLSNSSDYLPNIHTHRAGGPASGGWVADIHRALRASRVGDLLLEWGRTALGFTAARELFWQQPQTTWRKKKACNCGLSFECKYHFWAEFQTAGMGWGSNSSGNGRATSDRIVLQWSVIERNIEACTAQLDVIQSVGNCGR